MSKNIVLDSGTGMVKAGFAGENKPSIVVKSVVGKPKYNGIMFGMNDEKKYVCDQVDEMKGLLELSYPIEHGIINNWDDIENIWSHVFYNKLKIEPKDHNILMTEAALNPIENRKKMLELLFEKFNVKGTYVSMQAVLALYGSSKTTGVVVDSGDGVTHIVPVCKGYAINSSIKRFNLAGRDLTNYFCHILKKSGIDMFSSSEKEIVKNIKEELCFFKNNKPENEDYSTEYILPDGNKLTINEERYKVPEVLFNPKLLGMELDGLDKFVYNSINSCDVDLKRDLFKNIILSGGNTMIDGLSTRLKMELDKMVPQNIEVKIDSKAHRKFLVWIGGSILTSIPTFKKRWITKKDYDEKGIDLILKKYII